MPACKNCNTGFEFSDADLKIHAKMNVPAPTHCPDCRQQRRIAFRNDQNYYKNACHLCKRGVVSIYSPDKGVPVLCPDCFWSDRWDPLDYGQEFDFSRRFFTQFAEMKARVPRLAIFNTQSENSEFTVHSSKNRNCYMASSLVNSEDILFSDFAHSCKDSMDLLFCHRLEMCYQCVDSQDCTLSNYLELCYNMSESFFAFDCRGSKRLVGCVSLRNRKNHILNDPASKEECLATIQRLKTDPIFFTEFKAKYEALKATFPKPYAWMINTERCSGNYITNAKNAHYVYNVADIEDARYIYEADSVKDGYDITRVAPGEMLYDVTAAVDLKFAKFCNLTYQSDNVAYCDNSQNSHFSFGCMSLKGNQFCVLNKQYSEKEYKELVPRIIAHMKTTEEYGEFFPVELSPFGYNETKAQEFYPLTRDQALAKGWKWSDFEPALPVDVKTIPARRLPDNIKDVPDDILQWAILCELDNKPFKVAPQELKFYRLKGLPIPHLSPKRRHQARVALQNPRKLYDRTCDLCQKPIRTTYPPAGRAGAPDRPEQVVCEGCYLKIVY